MSLPYAPFRRYARVILILTLVLMASCIPFAQAKDNQTSNCPLQSDTDPRIHFKVNKWVSRGSCIRSMPNKTLCEDTLGGILYNLHKLREAEYAGAASVLSLLPTTGALFGPPTSEIWRLKSIVPFGGFLAMTLSFGGALMPVRVEDYEEPVSKQNTAIGSIISLRKQLRGSHKDGRTIDEKLLELGNRVRERIDQHESLRLPKTYLFVGLFGMVMLFAMAQAAMAVVEHGGFINWWCQFGWWMHLWYLLGKRL